MNDLLFTTVVLVLGVLALTTTSSRFSADERPFIWLSFLAHVGAAFAMIVVVRDVFEGGDMLAYHLVGNTIADQLRAAPADTIGLLFDLLVQKAEPIPIPGALPGSSTGSMQALSAILSLLFNGSLFGATLFVTLAAFFGKLSIFSILRRELPAQSARSIAVPCLLLPSVVFWSSGILKEPFAIIGMGALMGGAYALANGDFGLRSIVLSAFGLVLVSLVKPHILPPLVAAAAAWSVVRRQQASGKGRATTRALLVGGALAVVVVLAIGVFFQRFAPDQLAEEVAHMQEVGAQTSGGSQYTLIANPNASLGTQFALIPLALLTALFRPAFFEARTLLVGLNALEVTALTWLFVVAALRLRVFGIVPRIAASPALTFCALFVVGFGVGVGLTTTNLGTLSRYRMPLVPFFGVLLTALGHQRQDETAAVRPRAGESPA